MLVVPEERQLTLEDKLNYLQQVFQGLWDYRFMHRDMNHLLLSNDALHARYRTFFRRCLDKTQMIYKGLQQAGMIDIDQQGIEGLALNTWVVVTSWFSFIQCNLLGQDDQAITQDMVKGGVYQVFQLERPFLSPEYRQQIEGLQQNFVAKPDWL